MLFQKGTPRRIIDGITTIELPQILIVEAKELVAPATSTCLDTMMRTAKGKRTPDCYR
jgi:hypothetical protein